MKNDKLRVEITEVFMAKASKDERYHGTILRTRDDDGKLVCYGKINITNSFHGMVDGYVFAKGLDQDELGAKLDELVVLATHKDIHKPTGVSVKIAETKFFLS